MTDAVTRRRNLRSLKLTAASLADKAGWGRYTYWRDLLEDERKSFGEKVARRIEAALVLPPLWLDKPNRLDVTHTLDAASVTPPIAAALPVVMKALCSLSALRWKAVRGQIDELVSNPEMLDDNIPELLHQLTDPSGKRIAHI